MNTGAIVVSISLLYILNICIVCETLADETEIVTTYELSSTPFELSGNCEDAATDTEVEYCADAQEFLQDEFPRAE